ncbi:hypothetical protein JNL27_15990, partial [bacterium]|nr:hypothetical protein [bacterium]
MEPQQIIALLYLSILIILSVKNPRWALLFFFSTKFAVDIFWNYPVVDGLNILKITGALFPLFCGLYILIKRPTVIQHPFFKPLIVLFALNCVATSWGFLNSHFMFLPQPHSPLTFKHIIDWNLRFLNLASAVLVVPFILNESKDKVIFLRAFLVSTIIPCFISWYQLSSTSLRHMFASVSEPYSVSLFQRLNATYHDPGTLAIVMFTAVVISALLLFIEKSNTLKALYLLYAILCSIILYFTFSRTLWICVTSFLMLFFLNQKKYKLFFVTT